MRTAAWLGWQVESNWADPVLFAIYVVARPLATACILVAMMHTVGSVQPGDPRFIGFYLANAFHHFVNTVGVGLGWAVFEEREEYETLKYVYTTPTGLFTYLIGRSWVKFAMAGISTTLLLGLGFTVLGLRIDPAEVRWLPLAAAVVLGWVATLAAGLLLAGLCLVLTRAAITVIEGLTVLLYLLCGVIFPIDLMPAPLQWLSLALPFTWWYEALRRFSVGQGSATALAGLSDPVLLALFAALVAALALASWWGFFALERAARRSGRLDQTTLF
jgi:ABC-2 type transport system permease protein